MAHDLEPAVDLVRKARSLTDFLAGQVQYLQKEFERTHKELLEGLANARQAQHDAEQALRNIGTQLYLSAPQDGKQLYPGVSIREKVELDYKEQDALQWAFEGNALAITPASLNVEVFEKLARLYPEQVPFVRQCKTYTVILSRTL